MHSLNITLFYIVNSLAGHYPLVDNFIVFLTSYLSYIVCILSILYVVVLVPIKTPLGINKLKAALQSLEIILSVFFVYTITKAIKLLVAYPRPFEVLSNVHKLVNIAGGDSFPSNHAALTFAVATVVYFHHKKIGKFLFIFALIVSLSRLYVGVHYPIDIIVGALFGYTIPTLIHRVFSQKTENVG